ncbi:MAG: phosphatase PAP2 family protein [bacterium]|nr:phosphatase PAP2 family protein [bacterium]
MRKRIIMTGEKNSKHGRLVFSKNNLLWILSFAFLAAFLLLSHSVLKKEVFDFDSIIYDFIRSFHSPMVTKFFHFVTHFAGGYILVGICLLIYCFKRSRRLFWLISLNLVNTIVFNQVLKLFFARERPLGIAIIEESGYSFPSGHSMAAMSFYGLLIYIIYHSRFSSRLKKISIICLSILILLIGVSRIYLGVHYVSDVVGGFCLSLTYLIIFTRFTHKYILRGGSNEKEKEFID